MTKVNKPAGRETRYPINAEADDGRLGGSFCCGYTGVTDKPGGILGCSDSRLPSQL